MRMRVLTISDADEDDGGDPLLVAQVDAALTRRVLALVVDHLVESAPGAMGRGTRRGVRPLRPVEPIQSEDSMPDRDA